MDLASKGNPYKLHYTHADFQAECDELTEGREDSGSIYSVLLKMTSSGEGYVDLFGKATAHGLSTSDKFLKIY